MRFLTELARLINSKYILTGTSTQPYLVDWRGQYHGAAQAVVCPKNSGEVADIVRLCAQYSIPIVPQGGNTGLCGGATPDKSGKAIVISTKYLNNIRAVDAENNTIIAEAGCILQTIQREAKKLGRFFPLSLGTRNSCTIGGNLSTNAGGTQVLRYGSMRDLTLGIEVVTSSGEVWSGLRGLRKDNTGYDLKNIYIGSEGTLGIITAATLKIFPVTVASLTALVSADSINAVVKIFHFVNSSLGSGLTAFELIGADCLRLVLRFFPDIILPSLVSTRLSKWYVLLEFSDNESKDHANKIFKRIANAIFQEKIANNVVTADSLDQRQVLWRLREHIPLAEAKLGKLFKHDISIPISCVEEFIDTTHRQLQERFPGVRPIIFGHLGDGNLHYSVAPAPSQSEASFLALRKDICLTVYDNADSFGGSISAEHGIGQLKRGELLHYKSRAELDIMRRIKAALDPSGIMNPGKVL